MPFKMVSSRSYFDAISCSKCSRCTIMPDIPISPSPSPQLTYSASSQGMTKGFIGLTTTMILGGSCSALHIEQRKALHIADVLCC